MAEGDSTNDDAADAGTEGVREVGNRSESDLTSGSEAAGNDPAGFESSGVGDPQQQGEGGGQRPGDWNPGEQSGGGGELY
jgi:hypothetical protein